MGTFIELCKFRLKVFSGVFRTSKISVFLLAFFVLSVVPGTIGLSIAVVDSVKRGVDLMVHVDALSAVLSGILALILLTTFKGFVVFEYEQSFVFTSSITPRCFLIASLLSDITVYSFFLCPVLLFLGIVTVELQLPVTSVLPMIAFTVLFIFFLIFLKTSFSVFESVHAESPVKTITVVLMVLLLLPAVGLFAFSPLSYSRFPYPSTLLAQVLLHFLYGGLPPGESSLGLVTYLLISLLLFLFSSGENFQFAKPVPFVSPFDTSMSTQSVKMGKNIRLFSRAGLRIKLDLGSESLLQFLMKKELVRMIRDGSLFGVLVFYLVVSIMSVASRTGGVPFPAWMSVLAIYAFIVPAMLIGNWRISELDSLWVPLTSATNLRVFVRSLLYDFTLIALIVPVVTIVALTFVSHIEPLVPLVLVTSVSMIGCSTNLFAVVYFLGRKRKGTPSLMISWASMLLSGLLLLPTYVYAMFSLMLGWSAEVNILTAASVLVYSALIFWLISRKLEKRVLKVEM